jgi:hypothetical protein
MSSTSPTILWKEDGTDPSTGKYSFAFCLLSVQQNRVSTSLYLRPDFTAVNVSRAKKTRASCLLYPTIASKQDTGANTPTTSFAPKPMPTFNGTTSNGFRSFHLYKMSARKPKRGLFRFSFLI